MKKNKNDRFIYSNNEGLRLLKSNQKSKPEKETKIEKSEENEMDYKRWL